MKGIALALAIGTLTASRADGATAAGHGSAQPEAASPMVALPVVQTTPEPAVEREPELFAEWTTRFADDIGLQTDWEKVQ